MKKKAFAWMLSGALAAAALLSGCSSDGGQQTMTDEKKPLALLLSQEDEFLLDLKEAIEAQTAAQGYELLYYTAEGDPETQLRQMHEAYAAGAGTLLINMTNSQDAEDIAKNANDGGIVLVNRAPQNAGVLNDRMVFVGCNEAECGKLQGEALAGYFSQQDKQNVRFLMFQGVQSLENTQKRTGGALQVLCDSGFSLVEADDSQTCGFYQSQAQEAMEKLLAKGVEYDCIICNNDAMALGAAEAMEDAGIDPSQIPIVGVDNTPEGAEALDKGILYMTVDQNAQQQAEAAVAAAVNLDQDRAFDQGLSMPRTSDPDYDSEHPYIFRLPVYAVTRTD